MFFSHQMLAPSFDSTNLLLPCFPTLHKHEGVSYDFLVPFSTKVIYNFKSCMSKFPKASFYALVNNFMCLVKILLLFTLGFMDGLHEHGLARINSINKQIIMKMFITINLKNQVHAYNLIQQIKS